MIQTGRCVNISNDIEPYLIIQSQINRLIRNNWNCSEFQGSSGQTGDHHRLA
jgi:hypothetical protein